MATGCVAIALLAQAGDLFKSWLKREAGVKDSGNLIPGHGGVIDRLDGYSLTAPFLLLALHYFLIF
jgi:phosphatidate cytidylyltransferase